MKTHFKPSDLKTAKVQESLARARSRKVIGGIVVTDQDGTNGLALVQTKKDFYKKGYMSGEAFYKNMTNPEMGGCILNSLGANIQNYESDFSLIATQTDRQRILNPLIVDPQFMVLKGEPIAPQAQYSRSDPFYTQDQTPSAGYVQAVKARMAPATVVSPIAEELAARIIEDQFRSTGLPRLKYF